MTLTSAHVFCGPPNLGEEVQVRGDLVGPNMNDDEAEVEHLEVLLMFQTAIDSHEDLKLTLS
jgi:hypothetical protein